MKKTLKHSLVVCLVILTCLLAFTACKGGNDTPDQTEHVHTAGKWVVEVEATAKKLGLRKQVCSSCGAVLKEETIPATGYSLGLAYTVNDDGKSCTITGMGTCKETALYIGQTIDGYRVTAIGSSAFSDKQTLTLVDLPDSVVSIGMFAFKNCTALASVSFSDNLTSIGYYAFDGCTALASVTLGDKVTSIGLYAFRNCTALTSASLGNSVKTIGDEAFRGCSKLTAINLGNSVTSIGYYTFVDCEKLTSITLPATVRGMGNMVFSGCKALKDFNFAGTKQQWDAIAKKDNWGAGLGISVIHCSNGDVAK